MINFGPPLLITPFKRQAKLFTQTECASLCVIEQKKGWKNKKHQIY